MANENKNIKNLTLTELKKQAKKLDGQTEHQIPVNGDVYKVKIDDVFRKTKQYALLDDLVAFFDEGNNRTELLDVATPYTTLLFIKHFTSVEVSDDIDEAIELLNIMIDLDVLNAILNAMPEEEVVKVYEILSATADRMRENIAETLQEIERVKDQVENKVVLESESE